MKTRLTSLFFAFACALAISAAAHVQAQTNTPMQLRPETYNRAETDRQAVAFIEGGRVANEYSFSELSSDWQTDIGLGLRACMAGAVVRLDVAVSDEETAAWVMFGHPF